MEESKLQRLNFIVFVLLLASLVWAITSNAERINRLETGTYLKIEEEPIKLNNNITEIQDFILNCASEEGLVDSMECFQYHVKEIYNYTRTNGSIGFDVLLEKGGDCTNWTDLYIDLARLKGYDAQRIVVEAGEINHAFAIIYAEEGYCLADQRNMECITYGDGE